MDINNEKKGCVRVSHVYMVRCADDSLYTGWTNDLEKRIRIHNSGKGAKYTRSRLPVKLVYKEICSSKEEAQDRERQIKKLSRKKKLDLLREKTEGDCIMERLQGKITSEKVVGALIGMGRAVEDCRSEIPLTVHNATLKGMKMIQYGVPYEEAEWEALADELLREKKLVAPTCFECDKQCGKNNNFDMEKFTQFAPEVIGLKQSLLQGLLSLEPLVRGREQDDLFPKVMKFIHRGFFFVGKKCKAEDITPLLEELNAVHKQLL